MGFMDKIKNIFTEEEEEEPIKKEVIQVEIPAAKEEKKEEVVLKKEEVKKEEKVVTKPEEKFIFPVYFDDEDFTTIETRQKEIKRNFEEKKVTPKPISSAYQGKMVEEEKKVFKPTPIISPVYGVLDKNYTKEDITVKELPKNEDIDLVRDKAYGSNLDTKKDNKVDKNEHTNDMEEYHKKMEEVDLEDILEETISKDLDEVIVEKEPVRSRTTRKKEKLEENEDLFDMIDTMYEEEK